MKSVVFKFIDLVNRCLFSQVTMVTTHQHVPCRTTVEMDTTRMATQVNHFMIHGWRMNLEGRITLILTHLKKSVFLRIECNQQSVFFNIQNNWFFISPENLSLCLSLDSQNRMYRIIFIKFANSYSCTVARTELKYKLALNISRTN